jgi:hypothetical protein
MVVIEKRLAKAKPWAQKSGWAYLTTYREFSRLSVSKDEVIVQLKTELFSGEPPEEIRVVVEWNGHDDKSTPLPTSASEPDPVPP